ncbi:MAG: hypothetical protein EPO16_04115 [Dehalococcoidia bacterium]|nr:MAG: hypothetical protein EPO16_04115 [Dehalococcoidia bacterium]
MSAPRAQRDRLGEALRAIVRARRTAPPATRQEAATPPSLAEMGLRLAALEREVGEVRSRVNGLLFAVVASVIAQLASKLVAG